MAEPDDPTQLIRGTMFWIRVMHAEGDEELEELQTELREMGEDDLDSIMACALGAFATNSLILGYPRECGVLHEMYKQQVQEMN